MEYYVWIVITINKKYTDCMLSGCNMYAHQRVASHEKLIKGMYNLI